MIDIRSLEPIDGADVQRVMDGYTTAEAYRVRYSDTAGSTRFEIDLIALEQPYTCRYDHVDEETLQRYNAAAQEGFSFGAYDGKLLVGFVIAEVQRWNDSLWVWEFHVASSYRGQGLGRRLMERAAAAARAAGLRTVICETQNKNAPAIHAYRALGFALEGIDVSYYTNDDFQKQDIAVFMKLRL